MIVVHFSRFWCFFISVYIMCQCHGYPQDLGTPQYRRVGNQNARLADDSSQDMMHPTPMESPQQRRTFQRRHSASSQSSNSNATRPLVNAVAPKPAGRQIERLTSNTLRVSADMGRAMPVSTGRVSPVSNERRSPGVSTVKTKEVREMLMSDERRVSTGSGERRRTSVVNKDAGDAMARDERRLSAMGNGEHGGRGGAASFKERQSDFGRSVPSSDERVNETRHLTVGNLTRLDPGASSPLPLPPLGPANHASRTPDDILEASESVRAEPNRASSRRVDGAAPGRGNGGAAEGMEAARRNTDKQQGAGSHGKRPDKGAIVFPGQEKGSIMNRPRYVPLTSGDDGPQCANGLTFCETATDGYPNEHLRHVLKTDAIVFRQLFGNDEVSETNITQRIDTSEEVFLCVSIEEVVYPKAALSKEDKWLYIVNQDQYKQGVRIERCRNPDSECMSGDWFPFNYRSFCKQKFIYRKMLALQEDGTADTDTFKLPACCSCHLMRVDNSSLSRMGFDPATQSAARKPKRKRRRK